MVELRLLIHLVRIGLRVEVGHHLRVNDLLPLHLRRHLRLLLSLLLLSLLMVVASESGEDFRVNYRHRLWTAAVDGVAKLHQTHILAWIASRLVDSRVHAEASSVAASRLEHDFEALLPVQADACSVAAVARLGHEALLRWHSSIAASFVPVRAMTFPASLATAG